MGPKLDLVQNSAPGPLEATDTVAMSVLGLSGITEVIEDGLLGCQGGLRGRSPKPRKRRIF